MDDLNGFLKLENFILSLNMFYTLSHFAQCNPFYPLFPFLLARKWKREGTERQGEKCHLLVSECFSTALIHLCQQRVSAAFLFFPNCTEKSPPIRPVISLSASVYKTRKKIPLLAVKTPQKTLVINHLFLISRFRLFKIISI